MRYKQKGAENRVVDPLPKRNEDEAMHKETDGRLQAISYCTYMDSKDSTLHEGATD